ncbi:MAG TPA: 1-acyl-sn-glycerol-3-phosphate acyltransferase [Gemmatimonadaceae bacterium]|jgi:1-acyl-sn-glycerol-3-phosphate acyltransferase|nr:1-acyl-sn-glycerol-3-phosphate acyltransferase [Gemmatimonadaceae bacterium]
MIYRILQWISGIALHWYYRDIEIVHRDRIPESGPILVAVNHQNALVDSLVAQWIIPRRLQITAKATLANNIFGVLLVKVVGIIPLHRTSDEPTGRSDPLRNRNAFQQIINALQRGSAILIFPEGKSHNDPALAPLKTGLARVALRAREAGVQGIHIVPIGLTFEDKARPDTVVTGTIGGVLSMDEWSTTDNAQTLTSEIADRLRAVTSTADRPLPLPVPIPNQVSHQSPLITLAAWWGRTIHKIPIDLARRLALAKSNDPGEPATYTIVYGLAFILISYAIQIPIVWTFFGGWAALGYSLMLLFGAYWAAYARHTV